MPNNENLLDLIEKFGAEVHMRYVGDTIEIGIAVPGHDVEPIAMIHSFWLPTSESRTDFCKVVAKIVKERLETLFGCELTMAPRTTGIQ